MLRHLRPASSVTCPRIPLKRELEDGQPVRGGNSRIAEAVLTLICKAE
jgi:hypothetical protein